MIVWLGLVAGFVHVVSGPDHLTAVAPLALQAPGRALRIGASWGLGHGLGALAAGLIVRVLVAAIELDVLSLWAERAVGVALLAIGLRAIVMGARAPMHLDDRTRASASALGMGMLHGAAGAGHLFAVLPSLAMSELDAIAYLASYVVASTLTMSLASLVLGRLGRGHALQRGLSIASGVLACAVGALWIATS